MSSYLSAEEQRILDWLKLKPDAQSRWRDETLSSAPVRAGRRPRKPAAQPPPGTIAAVICEVRALWSGVQRAASVALGAASVHAQRCQGMAGQRPSQRRP